MASISIAASTARLPTSTTVRTGGDPVAVDIGQLVATRGSVSGWSSGHLREAQDTLESSATREITPTVETYPLADVEEAYERMANKEARFPAVLEP